MNNEISNPAGGLNPSQNQINKPGAAFDLANKPGEEFGLDETKAVVGFGISLANSIIHSLNDGKITMADIPYFIAPVTKLPDALAGISKVPYELDNIQAVDLQKLIEFVKGEIDIDDNKAKDIIDESLLIIYNLYNLIDTIKGK